MSRRRDGPAPDPGHIALRIERLGRMRSLLVSLAERHGTPLIAYDEEEARTNLQRLVGAFSVANVPVSVFYAIKSNPYPGLLRTITKAGHGLDASSALELRAALDAGSKAIVLTGPAKGREALDLASCHPDRVLVHLDSPAELTMAAEIAASRRQPLRCGVRVHTAQQSAWRKFGIPLAELPAFVRAASRHAWLSLCGVHFHGGTAATPAPVVASLQAIGEMAAGLPALMHELEMVDIGGGMPPEAFEGVYPWNRDQVMSFAARADLVEAIMAGEYSPSYEVDPVPPIEQIAEAIARAFQREILARKPTVQLWAEPGKFISHSVMHYLMRIVDRKGPQSVIVDAGTNLVGWEKYEFFDYAPIINLSRYAPRRERPVLVHGNLCTPHDLWGYYIRGRAVRVGDLLCVPYQGAYTFTLAQSFIRGPAAVVDVPSA